jgi:cytochrome c peroxidase
MAHASGHRIFTQVIRRLVRTRVLRQNGNVRVTRGQGAIMKSRISRVGAVLGGKKKWLVVLAMCAAAGAASAAFIPNLFPFLDPTGLVSTENVNGRIDENNAFFQSLGTNGRSCATCHIAGDAFGLSATDIQFRYLGSRGRDPLFASVDGANCPSGQPGNPADHSLLLENGLIRIPITLPASPQFRISVVNDPYGCGIVSDRSTGAVTVSVYRRPLPTTNLTFLSTIMFDGRETIQPLNVQSSFQQNLVVDLMHQAVDATLTHAQAANPPTTAQQNAIVNFELGLYSAQLYDARAGLLTDGGAQGGALNLSQLAPKYDPGINDSLGKDPSGAAFNPSAFSLYSPWANATAGRNEPAYQAQGRRDIAAGEVIFNTHPLTIANVRGLNDNAAIGSPGSFTGTCTSCHDTPNVGDHSFPLPLDIGTGHNLSAETDPQIQAALAQLSFPNVPVYRITGCPNPFNPSSTEPYVIYTTDPGKGLVTGLCSDVNRVKGPVLRGLAARAPYFHNGAARDLNEVVNFYNQRFQMNLTQEQESQLIAFLNSL